MSNTQFATLTLDSSAVAGCPPLPAGEPSHIHIQRPSRRAESPSTVSIVEQALELDELTLALDDAA